MRFYSIPVTEFSPDLLQILVTNFQLLENLLNGRLESDNIVDGSIATADLADLAVTNPKIAAGAVTFDKTTGIAGIAKGRYTGDGTIGREIVLGFRPSFVFVIRLDDSKIFESLDDATAVLTWWRTAAGVLATGLTEWQGVSANGFKVGSGAGGGTSNASTVVYSYYALR